MLICSVIPQWAQVLINNNTNDTYSLYSHSVHFYQHVRCVLFTGEYSLLHPPPSYLSKIQVNKAESEELQTHREAVEQPVECNR